MSVAEPLDLAQVKREELRERPWNVAIILVMLFGGIGLMVAAFSLIAGDWNFWTDWKDAVYWPLISATTAVFPLAAIQYIGWRLFRLPSATMLAMAFMVVWLVSQPLGFQGLTKYPANFTWPATVIPVAILLDVVLVRSRGNWLVTALLGGFAFGALFYIANYYLIAPFLQPLVTHGKYLTLANLQGLELHRSATPEYLRRVSVGGLHTFAGQLSAIVWLFTGAVCMVSYGVGLAIGHFSGVWPIERFIKRA